MALQEGMKRINNWINWRQVQIFASHQYFEYVVPNVPGVQAECGLLPRRPAKGGVGSAGDGVDVWNR